MMRATLSDRAAEALLAGEFQHSTHTGLKTLSAHRAPLDLMNVAISRETGTHEVEIATLVAQMLDWQLYDQKLLEHIANRMQVSVAQLSPLDEHCSHWLQETVAMMSSVPVVRESQFVRNLVESTLELGAAGHGVFIGRGAAWTLPSESTLRVALMAPLDYRVHVVMRELGVSAHEAAATIDERDRQHARFAKAHFCNNEIDPHAFDLVLNTSRLTPTDCAELICAGVRDRASSLERQLQCA